MQEWKNGERIKGKTIVCGHFHTSWGHYYLHNIGSEWDRSTACFEPFEDKGIIALDACTAYTHKVNCLVFNA